MSAQDSYAVLDQAKADGKIRHWGVSVNNVAECELAVSQGCASALQVEYNVINQSAGDAFAAAKSAAVGVVSRVPLNRGFLSGKIDESKQFSDDDTRRRSLTAQNIHKLQGHLDKVEAMAVALGVSAAELAIRFCVSNPNVACVIPGVRSTEQAKQNAASAQPLPADVIAQLSSTE
jgi:aryl-alcohol dehydrogenase-like predicted oxidoreductase